MLNDEISRKGKAKNAFLIKIEPRWFAHFGFIRHSSFALCH